MLEPGNGSMIRRRAPRPPEAIKLNAAVIKQPGKNQSTSSIQAGERVDTSGVWYHGNGK
jgi:hypothetical protein